MQRKVKIFLLFDTRSFKKVCPYKYGLTFSKSYDIHATCDRLTSNEPFSQERIRQNSDESKHAETHYVREKVKDTSRESKGEGKSCRVGGDP